VGHAQFTSQFPVVVDFTIKDDPITIGIGHGLITRAEVDDGQSPVGQAANPGLMKPHPFTIGTAVAVKLIHELKSALEPWNRLAGQR
jgi:hypothetical protein